MAYRDLSDSQFKTIKDVAGKVCEKRDFKTIGEFKKIGNDIIDAIESQKLSFADLLSDNIDCVIEAINLPCCDTPSEDHCEQCQEIGKASPLNQS